MAGMIGRRACRGKAAARALVIALAAAAPCEVRAQAGTATFVARDFRPASGAAVEVRLPYRTLGLLRRAPGGRSRNAVLILGASRDAATDTVIDGLFGPGQPLDTTLSFVILPDAMLPGPAASALDDGDLVNLQRRLVGEGLGVDHLVLVTGTARGCRQSRLWAARWPAMMDAALPVDCPPEGPAGPAPVSVASWRAEVADLLARARTERIE